MASRDIIKRPLARHGRRKTTGDATSARNEFSRVASLLKWHLSSVHGPSGEVSQDLSCREAREVYSRISIGGDGVVDEDKAPC